MITGFLCPICQAGSEIALVKDGCDYRECQRCRFLFHRKEQQPPGQFAAEFYDSRYWQMEEPEARRREQEDCFIRALELIYLSTIKVENVLDFGCGLGLTVGLLRDKLGLSAVGIDLSARFEPTEYLHRSELGELTRKYPPGFFDAIYSIEVFEHLEDPVRILRLLSGLLKPGGKMLINTGTREYAAQYDPEYIDPTRRGHISIYSLESLKQLASTIGYEARFLGDRQYEAILSPSGEQGSFPHAGNVTVMNRLGPWCTSLLQEYLRLILVEKEFEDKCVIISVLEAELESVRRNTVFPPGGSIAGLWKSIRRRFGSAQS
jgi:SAM-dependent methyltransferase